jgi:hypothetical protein
VIFDSGQFNEQVAELSQTVSLQSNNTLQVQLNGAPGDRLTLEITGFDNIAPQVTITNPAPGAVFSEGHITVTGTVDDPSATVIVNGIVATVAPDGTFTAEGVPLQEGENTLTVVAQDSCGNEGQDQISVHLETTPEGPELILCAEFFVEQIPQPPGETCETQVLGYYTALVVGLVDETVLTVTLNGVELPDGVEVFENGPIFWGMREGTFFWAFVNLPQVDGIHPFTAIVTDDQGRQSSATVSVLRDTVPPNLVITSPPDGTYLNTLTVTIRGTVDDPEATVRVGSFGSLIPVVNGAFEVTAALPFEGSRFITITARDPSGNIGSATLRVIRDTIAPAVTISTPAEGSAVNTPVLPVSGTITDSSPVSATVSVNGGAPETLTVTGSSYSGSVTLSEGSNTLSVVATDAAGNVGSATRSVLLDTVPPTVGFITPAPDTQVSGILSVNLEAADDSSGITQVSLLVDGQLQGTRTVPPYSFDLNTLLIPTGIRTLTARATDRAGNLTEQSISVQVQLQIQLQITSPIDGSTLSQSPILVRGTVADNLPEVGITVNGFVTQVNGGLFAVEGILLEPGSNTLNATATDGAGFTVSASAAVTFTPGTPSSPPVELSTTASSSLAPATVTFEAETALINPIVSYQVDFEGNGSIDFTTSTFTNVTHTYTTPGLYFPTLRVTDSQGNVFTATTVVNILDRNGLDALIQEKLNAMRAALINGDIDTALTYFVKPVQERYRAAFIRLASSLPSILSSIELFHLLDATEQLADAEAVRTRNGVTYSYPIALVKDQNGIWMIQSF